MFAAGADQGHEAVQGQGEADHAVIPEVVVGAGVEVVARATVNPDRDQGHSPNPLSKMEYSIVITMTRLLVTQCLCSLMCSIL